jgi:hypothetical protein
MSGIRVIIDLSLFPTKIMEVVINGRAVGQ